MKRDQAIDAVQTLHAFLRDTRPQWTHELPKAEGYYWIRENKNARPMVVQVSVDYSIASTPLVIQEGDPANMGSQFLSAYHGCQWAGPLEIPLC